MAAGWRSPNIRLVNALTKSPSGCPVNAAVCAPFAARRMMFKLLRCTCLHCFCLKMDSEALGRYRRRLALLLEGRLVEAAGAAGGASRAVRSTAAKIDEVRPGVKHCAFQKKCGWRKHVRKNGNQHM